jgi:hypothetical protein
MPAVRATSAIVEAYIEPGGVAVRTTSAMIEVYHTPGSANVRVTAAILEVYYSVGVPTYSRRQMPRVFLTR